MSSFFCFLESFFISISLFEARLLFSYFSEYISVTGRRLFVYFAQSNEELCSKTLLSKSVVIPV